MLKNDGYGKAIDASVIIYVAFVQVYKKLNGECGKTANPKLEADVSMYFKSNFARPSARILNLPYAITKFNRNHLL
jgi:hypothetical protein